MKHVKVDHFQFSTFNFQLMKLSPIAFLLFRLPPLKDFFLFLEIKKKGGSIDFPFRLFYFPTLEC